jgi:hypothetical protein
LWHARLSPRLRPSLDFAPLPPSQSAPGGHRHSTVTHVFSAICRSAIAALPLRPAIEPAPALPASLPPSQSAPAHAALSAGSVSGVIAHFQVVISRLSMQGYRFRVVNSGLSIHGRRIRPAALLFAECKYGSKQMFAERNTPLPGQLRPFHTPLVCRRAKKRSRLEGKINGCKPGLFHLDSPSNGARRLCNDTQLCHDTYRTQYAHSACWRQSRITSGQPVIRSELSGKHSWNFCLSQSSVNVRVVEGLFPATGDYCSFAYSALASFRMETSGSASFQSVRKS